ncbi:MAG: NAD(P)H-hydrate dehydratase [Candidatus Thermoplasmatota archaeon]|jgi:NAD(P)H-hydrate epimerase|nr:NAD(P)H-hydrate dehydratase [Candidatus Thermoplasmatota archaeon]MDP7265635.1 NAD(P)H-hydrate dehydratase [Candidatus Thermoplasmatota archaeon]
MLEFKEIHVLDRNSEFFGIPTSELMENAGKGAAEAISERNDLKGKKVCILAGKGNNGGDGIVLARYLHKLCKVTLILAYPKDQGSALSLMNLEKVPKKVTMVVTPEIKKVGSIIYESDIVVDALLGIGVSSEPREPIKGIIETLKSIKEGNGGEKPHVVSLDVSTGIGTDTTVRPDLTVTFHETKIGMTHENSGEIVVKDIGVPEMAGTHVGPGEFGYYPKNSITSHKGDNGVVMVVGGGPYVGAPVLASLAALRSGADLVHLFVPRYIYHPATSFSPDLIVHPIGEFEDSDYFATDSVQECIEFSKKCDSVVIGPGLGRHQETWKAVGRFISGVKKPLVVDADALYLLKHRTNVLWHTETILTPHMGEFMRLFELKVQPKNFKDLIKMVQRKAALINTTILLKGRMDIITDGKDMRFNETGHPAMTTGGTGDVLSGILGALLARGMSTFHAARLGAFISGVAGERAATEKSFGLVASDVVEKIPELLVEYVR